MCGPGVGTTHYIPNHFVAADPNREHYRLVPPSEAFIVSGRGGDAS